MNKHTRVNVTIGIDVQIVAAACNTAINIFAVKEEIHGKEFFCFTELANLMIHEFTLLSRYHQIRRSIRANRHIGKEPCKQSILINQPIKELFIADCINILAGIAAGNTKREAMVAQNLHCMDDLLERAFSAAGIRGGFRTFHADSRNKVTDTQHILCKFIINQSSIGKAEENTVIVLLTQFNNVILTHQRFSARVNIHVCAH